MQPMPPPPPAPQAMPQPYAPVPVPKKGMKPWVIGTIVGVVVIVAVIAIVAALFLLGVGGGGGGGGGTLTDCGTCTATTMSMTSSECTTVNDCMTESGKTCTGAKATMNVESAQAKMKYYMEFRGKESDKCVMYASLQMTSPMSGNYDMTCKIPMSEMASGGTTSMGSAALTTYCSGSMVDLMKLSMGGGGGP